ncbi:MAG: hypothetical protein ACOYH4_06040 [Saccharofermentanales bacterium]
MEEHSGWHGWNGWESPVNELEALMRYRYDDMNLTLKWYGNRLLLDWYASHDQEKLASYCAVSQAAGHVMDLEASGSTEEQGKIPNAPDPNRRWRPPRCMRGHAILTG